MRKILRRVICGGLIFLSVMTALAQDPGQSAVPKRKFKHRAELVSVYDKSKDQTVVVMQWYRVKWPPYDEKRLDIYNRPYSEGSREDNYLDIQAAFAYPGRVLTSSPGVLQFDIRIKHEGGSGFKSKNIPELVAVVDGEQISLGKTLLVSSKTATTIERPSQLSYERLSARFTYPGLLRLVNAKKVVMKIGQIEFELEEPHLEALRDLASRMVP